MSANERFKKALESSDEDSKLDQLDSAYADIRSGRLDVEPHIDELLGALETEKSEATVSRLWLLLSLARQNPAVMAAAEEALANVTVFGRDAAAEYILKRYPDKRRGLIPLADDPDPAVAYIAGLAMLPDDAPSAVRLWIKLLETTAPPGLSETLIEEISDHGDLDLADALLQRDQAAGGGTIWGQIVGRIRSWHGVEYLGGDTGGDEGRHGYWISCPNCERKLGVRSGHVGERARCKTCGAEFEVDRPTH